METWEVDFYETANGSCPVADFLEDQTKQEQARIAREVELLEKYGTRLPPPHVKHLDGDIYELRVRGKVHHRLLYAQIGPRHLLVLHAITKKRDEVRRTDIELAKSRLGDYRSRHRP